MEGSSCGQKPTRLPRWEEVARRESSERQADTMLCAGAAAHGSWNVTQFHCFEISPGIGLWAECMQPLLLRSITYMKMPANNQVILKMSTIFPIYYPFY